jgi:hypothetical protein
MRKLLQATLRIEDILRFQISYRFSLLLTRLHFRFYGNEIKDANFLKRGRILEKVAVLAVYPNSSPGYVKSIELLVRGLSQRNYTIICVANRKIPKEITDLLSDEVNFIAERKNQGRDFGSYQAGFNWLKKQNEFKDVEHLILVNDTLLWFDNVEKILGDLEANSWSCLFLNQEFHTHAQSFCLHFEKIVFTSQAFLDFWKNYLPSNYRRYAITFGEVAFTSALIKSGFTPKPVASLEMLNSKSDSREQNSELARYLPIGALHGARNLPLIFPQDLSVSYTMFVSNIVNVTQTKQVHEYFILENWLKRFIHSDPPHKIGLHLSLLYRMPMKRDIYKFHSLDNIYATLQVVDNQTAHVYIADVEASVARFMTGSRKMKRARRHGEV